MMALLSTAKPYSVLILRAGPNFASDDAPPVIWEHGRRNFGLRDTGVLAVVLPVRDDSDVLGVGCSPVRRGDHAIMAADPGVLAAYSPSRSPVRGLPGRHAA